MKWAERWVWLVAVGVGAYFGWLWGGLSEDDPGVRWDCTVAFDKSTGDQEVVQCSGI